MFVENKRSPFAKYGVAITLVLIGVVSGIVITLALIVRDRPDPKSLEEVSKQYVIEYTKKEQARLGVNCSALKTTIKGFLEKDIRPVLSARQPGEDWNQHINTDARKRMGDIRDYYFACGRLYSAAKSVKWDGMKDLDFSVELDREIIMLNTLLGFGEFSEQCNAACLDQNYRELQEAFKKIEDRLAIP